MNKFVHLCGVHITCYSKSSEAAECFFFFKWGGGSTIRELLERSEQSERSINWLGVPLVGVQGAEPKEARRFWAFEYSQMDWFWYLFATWSVHIIIENWGSYTASLINGLLSTRKLNFRNKQTNLHGFIQHVQLTIHINILYW